MTNHDLFASPKKHLRWADKAFDELEQLLATFGREAQHTSIIEFNPETGEHTAKVRVLSEKTCAGKSGH